LRSLPIALSTAPVVIAAIATFVVAPAMQRFSNPDTAELLAWLGELTDPSGDSRLADPATRQAAEAYVAERYRAELVDGGVWSITTDQGDMRPLRQTAEGLLARHPVVTPEEMARLSATLAPEIEERRQFSASVGAGLGAVLPVMRMMFIAVALAIALAVCLCSAIAVPGGIATQTIGLGVVRQDGRPIGRLRSALRALIAWAPAIAWFIYLAMSPKVQGFVPNPPNPMGGALLVLGVMAVGAIWTLVRTMRGPHDLIAGTWVVPH
jgi:hypothetical protein